MATTTRRRTRTTKKKTLSSPARNPGSKKTAKKVVSKKDAPTHLSSEDLRQIENLSKDVIIAKAFMATEEQALRNLNLELQLMTVKIEKQRELVQNKAQYFEQKKAKYADYMANMNPKYGLNPEDSLGYNPDSGELIR